MKRKFLCLLLALCMVLGLAANVSAEPEVITSGDWSYMIYDGMAQLRYYEGSDPVVTVPAEIDGYKVYSIGWGLTCPFAGVRDVLTDVVISEGVQMVERQCFKDCTKLKSVTLPSTITQIGTYAFQNCTTLKEIALNEGLEEVAHYAFLNTGLTSVYIPATVTFIGDEAFGYEGPMEDTQSMDSFTIYGYTGTAAHEYAQHYRFITFVDMGGNYDNSGTCGYGALWEFIAATGTLHIYVDGDDTVPMFEYAEPEEIPWLVHMPFITNVVVEDVLDIANYAFQGCANLTTVTMTNSVKYIRRCAFMDTPKLASVKLSANLESIDSYAFCNTSLASIDLPDGLTEIGFYAFSNSGLTSIKLPDSLTDIEGNAFKNTPLTSIEIPDSVTFLGQGAFHGCTKLTSVKLPAGLDEIYPQLFEGCTGLKTIDLPENLLVIGRQAFCGTSLTSIEIPSSVAAIDYRAFAQCENLKYLNLPADLVELYGSCFIDCPNLSAIAFRSDAPYFYDNTFQDTTLTAYYPADNATWTEEVRQNYGGTITWIPYEVLPFTDVPANSFYYEPVKWARDNKITAGVSDTLFGSADQCNRAQAVTFLWAAAGKPEPTVTEHPFVDVPKGSFCEKAVLWAVEKGITSGTDATHFSPLTVCNRATIVTFLYKALGSPELTAAENPFEDIPAESWYTAPVLWALENGITSGTDATHFTPAATCIRAQMVTFLHKAYNK